MPHAEPARQSHDSAVLVRARERQQLEVFSATARAGSDGVAASQGLKGRLNRAVGVQAIAQLRRQLSVAPQQTHLAHVSSLLQSASRRSYSHRPVTQLRLKDLVSSAVRSKAVRSQEAVALSALKPEHAGIATDIEQRLSALIGALERYEQTPDHDPQSLGLALEYVVEQRFVAISALDRAEGALQPPPDPMIALLIWLIDCFKDLTNERDNVVRRLPLATGGPAMLRMFPSNKPYSVGEGIRQIIDAGEPKIGAAAVAIGAADDARIAEPFGKNGPEPDDVVQGAIGDCWLLAPLISLASSAAGKSRLRQIVQPNDRAAEVYVVTLHKRDEDKLKPVSVAVSSRFAATNGRLVYAHGAALWPAIIEKAFAKMMGNAYDSLQGSTEGAITAFEAVFGTGTRGSSVASRVGDSLADAKAQSDVVHLVNTGEHVVVSSASHYYAVTGTLPDGLKLRNPHGHDETRSWADLKDFTYQVGRP